ncbi:MAG: DUF2071 domain-containing protein [Verrucomicrobiota bacterium]
MIQPSLDKRLAARFPERGTPVVMKQRWDSLLFLHWKISPEQIQRTLPPGLYVDTYGGSAWLGVVPFFMKNVRPVFCPPVPWLSWFHELNVRTYVYDDNGIPGVWFYSLDCDQPIAVKAAQTLFHLPYQYASMSSQLFREMEASVIHYNCRRKGQQHKASYVYAGIDEEKEAEPETLEFFLLERYYLYAWIENAKRLLRGQVSHKPYLYKMTKLDDYSTLPMHQAGFDDAQGTPAHQCYSSGANVKIYPMKQVLA